MRRLPTAQHSLSSKGVFPRRNSRFRTADCAFASLGESLLVSTAILALLAAFVGACRRALVAPNADACFNIALVVPNAGAISDTSSAPGCISRSESCHARSNVGTKSRKCGASCKTHAPFHSDSCHCCSSVEHIIANALEIECGYRFARPLDQFAGDRIASCQKH